MYDRDNLAMKIMIYTWSCPACCFKLCAQLKRIYIIDSRSSATKKNVRAIYPFPWI